MYQRQDGTSQVSIRVPPDVYQGINEQADAEMRTLNTQSIYLLKQSLDRDASPVGELEKEHDGPSKKLTVRFPDDELPDALRSVVEDESHSVDGEIKHRIMQEGGFINY